MRISDYRKAFSGVEPSRETREALLYRICSEEKARQQEHAAKAAAVAVSGRQRGADGSAAAAGRRRLRPALLAACAALAILTVSATAAAAFNLNDVFQGYFRKTAGQTEEAGTDAAGEGTALSGDDTFLVRAGNAVYEETAGDGLKIAVRGTVSDGHALYAALDVTTEDGAPFTAAQEDALESYSFSEVWLRVEGETDRRCGLERIDDGSEEGQATFLLAETFESDLQGKEVTLELRDFCVATGEVIDLAMERTIGELLTDFAPLTAEQVVQTMTTESTDSAGETTYGESFALVRTAADPRATFSGAYPESAISSMGVWESEYGSYLLLNLELGGELTGDLLENKPLTLIDERNGQVLCEGTAGALSMTKDYADDLFPGADNLGDFADAAGQEIAAVRYCFRGVSAETLAHAVLALGGEDSQEALYSGPWDLTFSVDYEETMEERTVAADTAADLSIKSIAISPASAIVELDSLSDEMEEISEAKLLLKDGRTVASQAIRGDFSADGTGKYQILWETIVDTEEVESLILGGTELSFDQ